MYKHTDSFYSRDLEKHLTFQAHCIFKMQKNNKTLIE